MELGQPDETVFDCFNEHAKAVQHMENEMGIVGPWKESQRIAFRPNLLQKRGNGILVLPDPSSGNQICTPVSCHDD
jgi:hypothetical protein